MKWYDKYFKWYQRKNIFDVYLDSFNSKSGSLHLVVTLKNGNKGFNWLDFDKKIILENIMQKTYRCAVETPLYEDDYEKYLLPTIGTERPDPRLFNENKKEYKPKCY